MAARVALAFIGSPHFRHRPSGAWRHSYGLLRVVRPLAAAHDPLHARDVAEVWLSDVETWIVERGIVGREGEATSLERGRVPDPSPARPCRCGFISSLYNKMPANIRVDSKAGSALPVTGWRARPQSGIGSNRARTRGAATLAAPLIPGCRGAVPGSRIRRGGASGSILLPAVLDHLRAYCSK